MQPPFPGACQVSSLLRPKIDNFLPIENDFNHWVSTDFGREVGVRQSVAFGVEQVWVEQLVVLVVVVVVVAVARVRVVVRNVFRNLGRNLDAVDVHVLKDEIAKI